MYAVFVQLFILVAVSDQNCSNTVGFLNYSNVIITEDRTFILDDHQHTITCKGNVIAWEFCYQIGNKNTTVSFNASVWKLTGIKFVLVNSNNITFTPTSNNGSVYSCQRVNLSDKDRFTAPAGSVLGLYSNTGTMRPQLLATKNNFSNITTYMFNGNPEDIPINGSKMVTVLNYSIAIKVYLG